MIGASETDRARDHLYPTMTDSDSTFAEILSLFSRHMTDSCTVDERNEFFERLNFIAVAVEHL
jgi:hypothetical protein